MFNATSPINSLSSVREYDTSKKIFVNAFPWLFPGGIGGLYDSKRGTVPIQEWARHLLRYSDGRFMKDKMFTFYVFNTIQRHINNSKGHFFFKSEHFFGKEPPSIEDLQQDLRRGDNTFINKLQYFSEGIRGSDGFWRRKTKELEGWINHHISEGNGPPTFFITLSCAENWWPDLRRLMIDLETNAGNMEQVELLRDTGDRGFTAMAKTVKKWPLYVNEFFMKRAKHFMENVVKEALGIKYYWGRVEFAPGRGQIHLHLLAIAEDQAYLQDYYKAKTGTEKAEVVAEYAERVLDMTADVDVTDDPEYRESKIDSPLKTRYCECKDKDLDCKRLAQACLIHHCNDYCLRSAKHVGPRECKSLAGMETERGACDTPGWERRSTHAIVTDNRRIRHLQMKRTHSKRVVQHSRTFLKVWRGNCDVKLLLYESDPSCPDINEIDNVVRYIVAYTGKKNKTHTQEKDIIHDLIAR